MMRLRFILMTLFLWSCSESINTYYAFEDFDILKVGSRITDLAITPDGKLLAAADMSNNRVILINVEHEMEVVARIWVGSEPKSLDISSSGDTLFVGLYGSSEIAIVDLDELALLGTFQADEDGPYDIVCLPEGKIIASFLSDYAHNNKTKLFNLSSSAALSSKNAAGPLTVSSDKSTLFVADDFYGPVRLNRFDISDSNLTNQIYSSPIAEEVSFHDILFVPGKGVTVALSGQDFDGSEVDYAFLFDSDDLNLKAHLDVKSPAVALAAASDGSSIFVSPSSADDAGFFVIEFSTETYLQANYYMTAGPLAEGALTVDPTDEYLYVAVDDPSDNGSFEPYSSNSYDIQRIKIVPWGTYPINSF